VFIALALFAAVSALLRHTPLGALPPALQGGQDGLRLPLMTGLLIAYRQWVWLAGLAWSVAMLASAVGLLLRLDWSRRVFIGVLWVAIAASLGGLWLQHEVVQSVVANTLTQASLPPQVLAVFSSFVAAARVMAMLMTLGACLVMAWIIRSLRLPGIRREFA
jgi:hypothetical protein